MHRIICWIVCSLIAPAALATGDDLERALLRYPLLKTYSDDAVLSVDIRYGGQRQLTRTSALQMSLDFDRETGVNFVSPFDTILSDGRRGVWLNNHEGRRFDGRLESLDVESARLPMAALWVGKGIVHPLLPALLGRIHETGLQQAGAPEEMQRDGITCLVIPVRSEAITGDGTGQVWVDQADGRIVSIVYQDLGEQSELDRLFGLPEYARASVRIDFEIRDDPQPRLSRAIETLETHIDHVLEPIVVRERLRTSQGVDSGTLQLVATGDEPRLAGVYGSDMLVWKRPDDELFEQVKFLPTDRVIRGFRPILSDAGTDWVIVSEGVRTTLAIVRFNHRGRELWTIDAGLPSVTRPQFKVAVHAVGRDRTIVVVDTLPLRGEGRGVHRQRVLLIRGDGEIIFEQEDDLEHLVHTIVTTRAQHGFDGVILLGPDETSTIRFPR